MKLTRTLQKVFRMSTKNHAKTGQFISRPVDPNQDLEDGEALPYLRYEVDFIPQVHVNKCGDACAAMLLQFKGKHIPDHIVNAINPRGILSGLTTNDLKRTYPPSVQWQPISQPEDGVWESGALAFNLKAYGPILCNFPRHFVLLTGIHENHLYLHDPWRGANVHYSIAEFNKKLKKAHNSECMLILNA